MANLYGLQDIEALKELEQCAHKYKYLRTAQGITDSLSIAVATGLSWSVYAEDKSLASDGYNLASSQLNDIPLDRYTRPERWVDTVINGHSNYVVGGLLTTNAVAAAVRLALTHRKLSCRAEFGRILEAFSNEIFEKWREQYREERPGPDPTEQISDKTKPATCAIDIGDVSQVSDYSRY